MHCSQPRYAQPLAEAPNYLLYRKFPAIVDTKLRGQSWAVAKAVFIKPGLQGVVLAAHLFIQQGLLGFKRCPQTLDLLARLGGSLICIPLVVACLLEFVLDNVDSLRGFLPLQLQGFLLLQKVVQFRPINLSFKQILFFTKPLLTGAQLFNGIFLGTDTGLGQFRLSARIR